MSSRKQGAADRDGAVLAHPNSGGITDAADAAGNADKIREQTEKIIKQALKEMGVLTSPEQMNTLVTGFVGLAFMATAEYRRARALYGRGPEAVDRLYGRKEAQV